MTCSRSRDVFALLVAVTLVTSALPPVVVGDHGGAVDWPDGPTRVFYADDPDATNVTETVSQVNASYADELDFYYRSTRPTFTANGTTLAEYRRQQLRSVKRSRENSTYLPFSELKDSDSGVIEDAHVTLLGVVGGGRPMVNGTSATMYIPSDGQVLNFLDYRVDRSGLPDRDRIDNYGGPNETLVKKDYEIDWGDSGVDQRVVKVNGREVGRASGRPEARVINYTDASSSDVVSLTVRATITIRMTYTEVTKRNGTVVARNTESATAGQVSVSDSMDVYVVDDQRVQIRQRLVDIEGQPGDRLMVTVDGPSSLTDRQLWSTLAFENGSVAVNNWGVYSTTQYHHGHVATESGSERRAFPHVLSVKFTSTLDRPYAKVDYSADGTSTVPSLTEVKQSNWSAETPTLEPQVNLSASNPTFVQQFAVEDAPGKIESGTDLFGRNVSSIETGNRTTIHEAEIEITPRDDEYVAVRLYDPDTGEGIGGRALALHGAASGGAVTNESGVALVNQTDRTLRVTFPGDYWRTHIKLGTLDPSRTYYSTARGQRLSQTAFWTGADDLVWRLLFAVPFVLGWLFVRTMDTKM